MNKTDLVKAVVDTGLSQGAAKKAVDAVIETIKASLIGGDAVQLIGFGTYTVIEKPARSGVNPHTGEKITIAAKKVVKFKAGKDLAEKVK